MLLDVFSGSAFDVMSLTESINRIPYKPARIGEMGLFSSRGVATTMVVVEEKDNILSLLPTKARGGIPSVKPAEPRHVRNFVCSHIPHDTTVRADEVQNIRAFGSETALQGVQRVVNEKIATMRMSHELTLEYHRLGAIKGLVLDSDGVTVIHNLFTEFGCIQSVISEGVHNNAFDVTAATPTIKATCLEIVATIERNLGAMPYDHIHCFCDETFFAAITTEAGVLADFARWEEGRFLRDDMRRGFRYGGIFFEVYRGGIGAIDFIEAGYGYFFPVGVPGLFITTFAPADYIETVNTVGRPFYAKQAVMAFDKGVMIDTQSNPLCLCTRPMALIRMTTV